MCLGIPGKVVEVDPENNIAVIEVFGVKRKCNTMMVGEVSLGEYLMVHTGYAIEKVDLEEAQERLKLWKEILGNAAPGEN
ncbi:MAG: HypC/HybG/HupF family hydrogenase formation chaperone [Peptococcaceae bacterium]|nr:HypC/HybG/HupF family hydrogenase formation chaperone [Peptococcaceae bacterium]